MDQTPNETHASAFPHTPLGEPMNQASASVQAEDPLGWHLLYWLSIEVVARIRGEDPLLMAARIEFEHDNIADPAFKTQLREAWTRFREVNIEQCERYWRQRTLDDVEGKKYLRDLDRMLLDKQPKMRCHLRHMWATMNNLSQNGMAMETEATHCEINRINQRLRLEETAEAEASDAYDLGA